MGSGKDYARSAGTGVATSDDMVAWSFVTLVPDWTQFRDQWEFTHTARAALFLLGFCALLGSLFLARSEAGRTPGRGENTG
ncbi:MAG: hypothetical protein ACRELW_06600 [Candidatus Rokuibacteriota bacterium]